jgi:hypothetical protein
MRARILAFTAAGLLAAAVPVASFANGPRVGVAISIGGPPVAYYPPPPVVYYPPPPVVYYPPPPVVYYPRPYYYAAPTVVFRAGGWNGGWNGGWHGGHGHRGQGGRGWH